MCVPRQQLLLSQSDAHLASYRRALTLGAAMTEATQQVRCDTPHHSSAVVVVATADAAPLEAYAPELPRDVLLRVLTPLAGDVATLAAAACVASAWRDAARDRRLWRTLCFAQPRVAARLNNARFATLVVRAGGALERVDLAGCCGVSARGVGYTPLRGGSSSQRGTVCGSRWRKRKLRWRLEVERRGQRR
jgi:hypothetical protein